MCHARFHLVFTPTSGARLNLVERWFAELMNRKLRRSAHRCVTELKTDVRKWVSDLKQRPQTVRLDQTADEILNPSTPTANESSTHDTSGNTCE